MDEASLSREKAIEKIDNLQKRYGDISHKIHTQKEASTRLLLIDEVLLALGWSKDDFNPETPAGSGYIDYLLSIDGIPRIIVEAKRVGVTFHKPRYSFRETEYSLKYFKKAYGRALNSVLDQAIEYACENGIQYTVITNGAEWFVAQVIASPGQHPDNLKGFYFGDILSQESNFELFWELLSKQQVKNGSLEERLYALNYQPARNVQTAAQQFGIIQWKRTSEFEDIREFYEDFFGSMVGSRLNEMLNKCYVENTKLSQFESDLKHALKDSAPSFMPDSTQDVDFSKGKNIIYESSQASSGRVILIIGSVGCGKSTFVSKVVLDASRKNSDQERAVVDSQAIIRIDLINESTSVQDDIEPLLWKYIIEKWKDYEDRKNQNSYSKESLKKLFWRELRDFSEGEFSGLSEEKFKEKESEFISELKKDNFLFFSRCWKRYHGDGVGIVLILDDIDRTSEILQSKVYAFAHKLADQTGITVILTLREFTFFRARESGFLDVRGDKYLHLQSPDVEQVISKRIKYIESHFDDDYRAKDWRRQGKYECKKNQSRAYANTLKENLLESQSGRDILGILRAISWHNVRDFLDILSRVHSQLGRNGKPWNESEIISTLMILNDIDLTPAIPNIFRPTYHNHQSYFLKIRILLLFLYGIKSGESRGGLKFFRLTDFCRLYGYQTTWIKKSIQELVRERLLECLEAPVSQDFTKSYELNEGHTFRISPLAVVLTKTLVFKPIYLCLIGNELPFYNQEKYSQYSTSFKELIDTLDFQRLERSAIDLLLESTDIGAIVSSYLVDMHRAEMPANKQILNLSEISSTESKLNEIIQFYIEYSNNHSCKKVNKLDHHSQKDNSHKASKSHGSRGRRSSIEKDFEQLDLLFGFSEYSSSSSKITPSGKTKGSGSILKNPPSSPGNSPNAISAIKRSAKSETHTNKVYIPENIDQMEIENSEYIPLIFWSLIYLNSIDESEVSGKRITDIINEFLVHEHKKKLPNNVSRALRSENLKKQEWLKITERNRKNYFGIKGDWKIFWKKYFGSAAPEA